MKSTRVWIVASVLVGSAVLSGCTGISMTKAGEQDAQTACAALAAIQGEDITIEEGIAGMAKAEVYAKAAADANDDYVLLYSGAKALGESMTGDSFDLVQSAWANIATICTDLS